MKGYREVFHRVTSRNRSRLLVIATVIGLVGLYFIPAAQAVHDTGRFQLDGDAASGTNTTGITPSATDDWDKVCHQFAPSGTACGTTSNTTGATAGSWVSEPNPSASIFTGGGSKDPQDISNWLWKDAGGLPDKDNLRHGFAVRYSLPDDPVTGDSNGTACPAGTAPTCDVLYFGSDRFDNSGDAQQGFWFFQNKVTLTNISSQGGLKFSGLHKTGDLLVISDFSIGGTVSTITIYKWNPAVSGNLELLETSDAAKCTNATAAGDAFCGIVNPSTITMPWAFTDKSGTPNNQALQGEFYEGGINLSTLGLSGECFSSVASETRSSTSTTATLKDFILGQFAICAPTLTTDVQGLPVGSRTVSPGTAVHDTATITVTGATTPDDATGTVDFFLCGPDATANPDCSSGGVGAGTGKALVDTSSPANTHDGISGANSDDVNTAANPLDPGFYCFRALPHLTNYDSPGAFTNDTSECFRVRDTSTTTTAQNWVPNDTATVLRSDGVTPGSGTVDFALYITGDCTGPALHTFAGRPVDGSGLASTDNSTFAIAVTPGRTISWRATFTSSDPNVVGSTSHCERSIVTINDDIGS